MNVTIYSKPNCPNCEKAKQLARIKGFGINIKQVGVDIQKEQLEEMIGHQIRSVPQIFINHSDGFNEYVGGFDAFQSKVNSI